MAERRDRESIQATKRMETSPLALKPIDVAAMLSVGRTSIYRLIQSGDLHAIRVGSDYRITRQSVEEFLSK